MADTVDNDREGEKNGKNSSQHTIITDMLCIVGENGAGKTMLFRRLLQTMHYYTYGVMDPSYPFELMVFLEEYSTSSDLPVIYVAGSSKGELEKISIVLKPSEASAGYNIQKILFGEKERKQDRAVLQKKGTKDIELPPSLNIAVFNNMLNSYDYFYNKTGYVNDFTVGGMIRRYAEYYRDMHYISNFYDPITIYTEEENFHLIEFAYEFHGQEIVKNFPSIETGTIRIKDNEPVRNAIREAFEKSFEGDEDKGEDSALELFKKEINIILHPLVLIHSFNPLYKGWVQNLLSSTFSNFIKDLCVPVIAGENRKYIQIAILKTIDECEKLKGKQPRGLLKLLKAIINNIESSYNELKKDSTKDASLTHKMKLFDKKAYNSYIDFVAWVDKHNKELSAITDDEALHLDFKNDTARRRTLINQFLKMYRKVWLPFPFLIVEMHLPDGYYNFLTLFSNLYRIRDEGSESDKDYKKDSEPLRATGVEKEDIDDDGKWLSKSEEEPHCKKLLILIDEGDEAMHPRLQRKFVTFLTAFINHNFSSACDVQVIITTHSPILLSDFPGSNVLFLKRYDDGSEGKGNKINKGGGNYIAEKNLFNTFGQNIASMYLDSFFLENDGIIGEFAKNVINGTADRIRDGKKTDYEETVINNVADPVLHNALKRLAVK